MLPHCTHHSPDCRSCLLVIHKQWSPRRNTTTSLHEQWSPHSYSWHLRIPVNMTRQFPHCPSTTLQTVKMLANILQDPSRYFRDFSVTAPLDCLQCCPSNSTQPRPIVSPSSLLHCSIASFQTSSQSNCGLFVSHACAVNLSNCDSLSCCSFSTSGNVAQWFIQIQQVGGRIPHPTRPHVVKKHFCSSSCVPSKIHSLPSHLSKPLSLVFCRQDLHLSPTSPSSSICSFFLHFSHELLAKSSTSTTTKH